MNQTSQPVFVRQQLLIDQKVQGALLKRAGFYSIACALYFVVILIFAECMSRQSVSVGEAVLGCFEESIYWLPGLLLMAPMIAYDMLKQTNRFAGPVFRLRREMQRLVANESDRPLNFRNDDYWKDLADEFNQIRSELLELREAKSLWKKVDISKDNKLFNDATEQDVLLGNLIS